MFKYINQYIIHEVIKISAQQEKEYKSSIFTFNLYSDEKVRLRLLAFYNNITMAEFLRQAIEEKWKLNEKGIKEMLKNQEENSTE